MTTHIACLVDLTEQSVPALREAARLRDERDGRLSVVLVDTTPSCPLVGPEGGVWIPDLVELRAEMSGRLATLATDFEAEGVLLIGDTAWSVSSWAQAAGVDVLVVAEGGSRLARRLAGSFARRLLRMAPCPVLFVPDRPATRSRPAAVLVRAQV